MAVYADEVPRLTLRDLLARFRPRVRDQVRFVELEHAGHHTVIELVLAVDLSVRGGVRRYIRCPRCGRAKGIVIGFVPELGWCCRTCARWRARNSRTGWSFAPAPAV